MLGSVGFSYDYGSVVLYSFAWGGVGTSAAKGLGDPSGLGLGGCCNLAHGHRF